MKLVENNQAMSLSSMSDMSERGKIANSLAKVLAVTYMIYLKTQYYHWNVTGKNFVSLHELFEKQYLEFAEVIDELAERIRALGYYAPGTFNEFLQFSEIKEDETVPDVNAMLKNLLDASEKCIKLCEDTKNLCKDADVVTEDMMVSRIKVLQKNVWMLRSILVEC